MIIIYNGGDNMKHAMVFYAQNYHVLALKIAHICPKIIFIVVKATRSLSINMSLVGAHLKIENGL